MTPNEETKRNQMSEKLNVGKTWKFSITYGMNFVSFISMIISRLKMNLRLGYASLLTHEDFNKWDQKSKFT